MITFLKPIATALDQIEVAICVFDANDKALVWNDTFLQFFPEHAGHIHAGEDYRENLRRFYLQRLSAAELPLIDRYIAEAVQRHHHQQHAIEFDHYNYRVRVASLPLNTFGRVRLWRKTVPLLTGMHDCINPNARPLPSQISPDAAAALESLGDGILMVDKSGESIWANHAFLELYGLACEEALQQRTFSELYALAWKDETPTASYTASAELLKERQRFSGAPYVLALPKNRWVRVVELRGTQPNGSNYLSHVDVTESRQQQEVLMQLSLHLESISTKDAMTGLANRRRFDEVLESEWQRALRAKIPLSLLMLDLDYFKYINDTHGHPFGDEVLKRLADILSDRIKRAGSLVARFGGDEFAVLLPDTDIATAAKLAEFLRIQVENMSLGNPNTGLVHTTISVGVASTSNHAANTSTTVLIDMADKALYEAKRSGRNRVATATAPNQVTMFPAAKMVAPELNAPSAKPSA